MVSKQRLAMVLLAMVILILMVALIWYRAGKPGPEAVEEVPAITEENTIHFSKAPERVGEELWVYGEVDHVFEHPDGHRFVNFCPDFRDCPFYSPIFDDNVPQFADIAGWSGEEIHIYGEITTYQGRPQIVVESSKQVELDEVELKGTENEVDKSIDQQAELLTVIDGDTIQVRIDGRAETVRLIGIDSPEVDSPYTKEECFGPEATEGLKGILENEEEMVLLRGKAVSDRDQYDRLLRYLFLPDGVFVNTLLVEEGYAFADALESHGFVSYFNQVETEARESRRGLWGEQCDYYQ